ncbi:outer membrane protein assembly factor BamB family protein [Poritiphilus flavus]|uniref:PQQ-binding-like beta-propeller repeat protein n=1 Tax=Poritiphilus flavus TaxID=2697053 RepID=A0A6L9EF68_9FLAO|nr:PQQ-binding-like beta-propeller repeat protein [Poritiphilus flavus]NAS13321.1 PQQ-binding-like beta-propeller repeat protein [Poritiphilus flavus]
MSALSQQKIEFARNISEQRINSYTGTLLIKTKNGVYGVDPETNNISWGNEDLKKASFSEYSEIPFTPIVLFTQKPFINSKALSQTLNSKGASKKIISVYNGKMLFDSEKEGFKAVNKTLILPQRKAILVDGVKDKELLISLFSYESGELLWEVKASETGFFKNLKGAFFDDEEVMLDADQNIYWLKNKHLLKIDGGSGEILFEQEKVTSIAMNASQDVLFVFSNSLEVKKLDEENSITALNCSTMDSVWQKPVNIWGNISDTAQDHGKLVVITSKGFNIIDIPTGNKKWERSDALPLIKKIVPLDQGYLVVQDNFLVRINERGKKAWEKKVKITFSALENPIYILENKESALYISPSQANVVNIKNGIKTWEENLRLNTAGFISRNLKLSETYFSIWNDSDHKLFPVYSEKRFYIFDPASTEAPEMHDGFEFTRTAPNLKIRKSGYLLFRDNLFYFHNRSGEQLYQKSYPKHSSNSILSGTWYWEKRGLGTATSALGFVGNQITGTLNSVLVSADLGLLSNVSSSIYGTYLSYQGSLDKLTSLDQMDIDLNVRGIFDRIKAGRKNEGSLLIVSPKDEVFEIIRLDIDQGTDQVIKTVDNSYSDFIIDQVAQQIYFFKKKTVLVENLQD